MITYSEEKATKLSATKKDFYQIWNELLETASKISERWDPTSTNESDPGIILLKVLTAVADKLNYEIDMNALEDFMPSAAQEESMRKLTEMLGYNMKYYQSATTDVQIAYNKPSATDEIPEGAIFYIDRFTNIKDIDDTINYITLRTVYLNHDTTSKIIPCMEGELVECETDDDNIISMLQLDDNNRYYLPETQIAENGIFITNIDDNSESDDWEKVDNLNTQQVGKRCFKFGYDSKTRLPYVQFPEDISTIIEDGLKIRFVRTKGANGNISPKTLYKMEKPQSWLALSSEDENSNAAYYNVDNYTVSNSAAAKNGANLESLNDAYNNFKKTIGTFDTLVTCRDYMNKIYQLTLSDTSTINLVSNIIVSDIRDDINKAVTICTFGDFGIEYNNVARPLKTTVNKTKSEWDNKKWAGEGEDAPLHPNASDIGIYYKVIDGDKVVGYYTAMYDGISDYKFVVVSNPALISPFDLVFYPFKNVYGLNTKNEYVNSFKYDDSYITDIKEGIEESKTLSHNIILPNADDLACIKNYYNLNAKITTTRKVNVLEQKDILNNVYTKLYENFNMRKVDFGEEISYDAILKVMEDADPRIKNVSLEDPTLETKFCTVEGSEYATTTTTTSSSAEDSAGNYYYNKLVLNNVLAGRVPLFNYDENFKPSYNEVEYPKWKTDTGYGSYDLLYPDAINSTKTNGIDKIVSKYKIEANAVNVKLNPNEVIQFRLPNLKTTDTYPAYVNYFIKLNNVTGIPAIPATMKTLKDFLNDPYPKADWEEIESENSKRWVNAINYIYNHSSSSLELAGITKTENVTDAQYNSLKSAHFALFTQDDSNHFLYSYSFDEDITTYYHIDFTNNNFGAWDSWIKTQDANYLINDVHVKLQTLYWAKPTDLTKDIGYLVDKSHRQFLPLEAYKWGLTFVSIFVADTHADDRIPSDIITADSAYTKDGLGQNAVLNGIEAKTEYKLKSGEYLLLNYTKASSDDSGSETKTVINKVYFAGTIIKPNFDLVDSLKYRTLHNYSKTTGYDFSEYVIDQPAGMFTLGTDQQIEIRNFVTVDLDKQSTNLYWERNDEIVEDNDRIYFKFDEEQDGTTASGKPFYTSYILKEGEYLYYTNSDKADIAYYGAGTKITRTRYTPDIFKSSHDALITAEDIATQGLSAAIPWRSYDLSDNGDNKRGLVLTEYQYINLTKGDILNTLGDGNSRATKIEQVIDNTWRNCTNASYTIEDAVNTLPPVVLGDSISWQVRSLLELNISPTKSQQLYSKTGVYSDTIEIYYKDAASASETITPHNDLTISLKANKVIQSTRDTTSVVTVKYTETGGIDERYYDCQLKVFNLQDLANADNAPLNMHNFGEGMFTKIAFDNMSKTIKGMPYTTINALVPEHRFGLLLIQNNRLGTTTNTAAIRLIKASGESSGANPIPAIYNNKNNNGEDIWWDGKTSNDAGIWATEGTFFGKLTLDQFTALKSTLYVRTIESTVPDPLVPRANYRYEYAGGEHNYFHYTKVEASTAYSGTANYCQLLDTGADADDTKATVYHLRDGINIVRIDDPCRIQIFADGEYKDILIFSDLDIIYENSPINPKLKYKKVEKNTEEEQILADIKAIDPHNKFYYNAIMDNETVLDLNEEDPDDTMENPLSWYNYNNAANKFVISEINAEYLPIGVTIARNSKL